MFISNKHMSRRTVLRGIGATVALPLLDAMVPARTLFAQGAANKKLRFVALEMVHGSAGSSPIGIQKNLWAPAAAGRSFDLSPSVLSPLEPYRDYLTIVSNTDVRNAEAFTAPEIGGDHFRSSAVFLTQSHPKQTQGSDLHAGVSLDQIIAKHYGQETPIPSMQLCIENVDQAGGCSYGYSCAYTDSISWASPSQPLPMIRDPRLVFDQLFGVGATPAERKQRRSEDRSILDWLGTSINRMKRDLGAADRARLNDYLDDVREIERRIQKVEAYNSSGEPRELPGVPVGVPDSFTEHVKLMFDLQVLAFASDLTRVFAFKLGRDASNRVYPESGFTGAFHSASHHQENEERILDFAKINKYHVSLVPYFLEKLKNTSDGDSNLLASSVILYGSPMGDSNVHNHKRVPMFIAGHAGGALKGHLHVKAPEGTPMANAMLTLAHALGLEMPSFGDSSGTLDLSGAAAAATEAGGWGLGARGWGLEMLRRNVMRVVIGALSLSALLSAAPSAPVADAAMQGDTDAVLSLLKQAADVNAAQGDGMTALHWAAMNDDADLAETLLFAGANVKTTTRIGAYTPLLLAAKNGSAAVMVPLLKAGAEADVPTSNGTTPLMFAAASGNVETVKTLVDHGADVNAKELVRGLTPLMFAAASNRAAVLDLLAKKGADLAATSKVTDLAALSRDEQALHAFTTGNPPPPGAAPAGSRSGPAPGGPGDRGGRGSQAPGVDRNYQLNELVAAQGGLTPLLLAAREGHVESVQALLNAGASVNQTSAGDKTSPLLIATINGHFDLARLLLENGAEPNAAAENNATALYAALNCEWAPKALYPQPRAQVNQETTYLELMQALLDKGADPNVRLNKKVWYSGYSFDLSGVDEAGATPFWRAAYASDVDAMKMLVAYGADPNIRTKRPAGRPRAGDVDRNVSDVSGLPPVPVGGPAVTPLQAAAGVGYGEGFAANSHRFAPGGMLAAVTYLVDALHADVNAFDHEGDTALHHAAARGDVEMIQYLVSRGADVKAVSREGRTTADMANGPVQRIQPFPEALALLEKLGATNNHKCVSC